MEADLAKHKNRSKSEEKLLLPSAHCSLHQRTGNVTDTLFPAAMPQENCCCQSKDPQGFLQNDQNEKRQ